MYEYTIWPEDGSILKEKKKANKNKKQDNATTALFILQSFNDGTISTSVNLFFFVYYPFQGLECPHSKKNNLVFLRAYLYYFGTKEESPLKDPTII